MSGEYDLVVIGGGAVGMAAATHAAKLSARVVLVDQGIAAVDAPAVNQQVLRAASRSLPQRRHPFLGSLETPDPIDRATLTAQLHHWTAAATDRLETLNSPAILAALGVEVIAGQGSFHRRPSLGFEVRGRSLRSWAYFLVPEFRPRLPAIDGLGTTGFLPTHTFQFSDLGPSNQVVILGHGPTSIELAQSLTRLGLTVTLAAQNCLLPQEDRQAAQLIQAHLEAEGVRILTQAAVTQVRQIQNRKWVQVGDQAIETDEILLEAPLQPNLERLNLAAAAVRWGAEGIVINSRFQTTNPRIYAGTPQSDANPQLATYEARRAIDQALGFARSRLGVPLRQQVVDTDPELVRVGLTEPQAVQQYGKAVQILRQSCKTLTQAQIQDETTGLCQLIVGRNGVILGAHLVGKNAGEGISPIVLAMQQNLKVDAIAGLLSPFGIFDQLIQQTAAEWQYLRSRQNFWQRLGRILKSS